MTAGTRPASNSAWDREWAERTLGALGVHLPDRAEYAEVAYCLARIIRGVTAAMSHTPVESIPGDHAGAGVFRNLSQ